MKKFRDLKAKDLAPLSKIIAKINFQSITSVIDDEVNEVKLGAKIISQVISEVVRLYSVDNKEINAFLKSVLIEDINLDEMKLTEYINLIKDFIFQEEIKGFFSQAIKYLK